MPVPALFGSYAQGGGASGLTFVGSSAINGSASSQAVTFPAGTAAGDLALILDVNFSTVPTISGSSGWTTSALSWSGFSFVSGLSQKVLVSGDLSGVTANGTGGANSREIIVMVYRGATLMTVKSTNPGDTASTLTLAGFTKSAGIKGIVSLVQQARTGGPGGAIPLPPGTMIARASGNAANVWLAASADIVNPSSYIDGTSIIWTGFVPASFSQVGYLCELT